MSPTTQVCRVLCVDDHPDIRTILNLIIGAEDDMCCVGCLSSANNLLEDVDRLYPDVVILDASMPGIDPFIAVLELASAHPVVKTIVYSAHHPDDLRLRATMAGAWACICKADPPEVLLDAIREASSRGHVHR